MFITFYNDLFTSTNPSQIEQVVEKIPRVVTPDMNHHLTRDFVPLEVIEAVKQIHPSRPGPRWVTSSVLPKILAFNW